MFKGLWLAVATNTITDHHYFVIVNSKNEGRVYDDMEYGFPIYTIQFDSNGIYRSIKLLEKQRGQESFVGTTSLAWPTLSEKYRMFIES